MGGLQYIPVKFFTCAPIAHPFRIEEEHVAGILVGPDDPVDRVVFTQAEHFDHGDIIRQLLAKTWRLISMQLHHIQTITVHLFHHVVIRGIDKDAYLSQPQLCLFQLFSRQVTHYITGGFGVKNKPRKIHSHSIELLYLVKLSHSADFYSHKFLIYSLPVSAPERIAQMLPPDHFPS